jgi:hypothetical protein
VAPPNPEARLQSLPPILRRTSRNSLPSCSKGSWGLSVLPPVEGIFTPNTISLSPWSRQRGCCYAIRAGRNLPDKEFRYLRTVHDCYIALPFGRCHLAQPKLLWQRPSRFRLALHVAMQIGPYHLRCGASKSGIWSLRIPRDRHCRAAFPADCPHRTDCHYRQ